MEREKGDKERDVRVVNKYIKGDVHLLELSREFADGGERAQVQAHEVDCALGCFLEGLHCRFALFYIPACFGGC